MGKSLIQQKRGKGGPTYRAPSFRYVGEVRHPATGEQPVAGKILDIVHCPGHSGPLAVVEYQNGQVLYMLASEGMKQGDVISAGKQAEISIGNTSLLGEMPEGTLVYNIEAIPGDGGKFARASGTFGRIVAKIEDKVVVQLPSKKEKTFDAKCKAAIGIVAGGERLEKPLLRAGNNFYKMKARNKLYPRVSGTSMNAVDHPFGGSSTHHKGKCSTPSRFAPPGAKVGLIRARQTGRRKGKKVQV
ncbi:50S ribosomal protein L2 [Candidatus Woesearchaeota archaeon]|nr:50S ribosomal protein L2 [Candidatus Woesearchaeota archaeon]